jgi:hypothetical protein
VGRVGSRAAGQLAYVSGGQGGGGHGLPRGVAAAGPDKQLSDGAAMSRRSSRQPVSSYAGDSGPKEPEGEGRRGGT